VLEITYPWLVGPRVPPASNTVSFAPDHPMRSMIVPRGLTATDLDRLNSITSSTRLVKDGTTLYRENDSFRSIYFIRAGSFKTVVRHRDGPLQVTGFYFFDDALGFEGISTMHHNCEAVALEDSSVRIVPFLQLELLCRDVKAIQEHVHRMMSSEIARESALMMLLGTMTAEQRLAAFLLNISIRFKARGYSPVEFNLRMSREEIGCYLGIKLETVSRMFSEFRRKRLVDTDGKQIHILDLAGLGCI